MENYIQDNIMAKYYNNLNKKYDVDKIKFILDRLNYHNKDIKFNISEIDTLATNLYKFNNILNESIETYYDGKLSNNKKLIEKLEMDNGQINKLENIINKQKDIINNINRHISKIDGKTKIYTLTKDNGCYGCKQVGGFLFEKPGTTTITKVLDLLQLILDILGFFPIEGMIVDAISMIISLLRRQWFDALCSAINIIPLVGSFIGTPMKYIEKYREFEKAVKKVHDVQTFVKRPQNQQMPYMQQMPQMPQTPYVQQIPQMQQMPPYGY